MLPDHRYDKIKIIHDASCLAWFIEKHALEQADKSDEYINTLEKFKKDLEKYIADFEVLLKSE